MPGAIVTAQCPAPLPGWYGKIPALGDFASRRLPPDFIGPWDAWLQRALLASRALLGERWPAAYLGNPAWRFVLWPGACGPGCWAGLLLPSVDKVGRYFPLTIAAALDAPPQTTSGVLAAGDWFDALEAIALAAREAGAPPAQLDAALLETPYHGTAPDALDADACGNAGRTLWWQRDQAAARAALRAFCGMPPDDYAGILLAGAQ